MKISIAIQYFNRKSLLINTLNSIINTSLDKKDVEIIIVDDASDEHHQIKDIPSLYEGWDIKIFSFSKEEKWWGCPVIPLNKSIAMSTGDIVVLLCAEVMFVGDILLDIKNRIKPNDYLVYSVLSLTPNDTERLSSLTYKEIVESPFQPIPNSPVGTTGGWYQHSIYRDVCFNFCTAITKKDIRELGGFDERFGWGTSHGDDDFLNRIKRKGMNIISIDSPFTYHQYHPPMIAPKASNNPKDNDMYLITQQEKNIYVNNSFLPHMKIIYRISDTGYNKIKPDYINNENCLKNFCNIFFDHIYDIHIIADNCSEPTMDMIKKYIDPINIEKVSVGHGAGTFNLALDKALKWGDDEIVYFVENDYIHLPGSPKILEEGFGLGASYVTLYLHPDKFISPHKGGNPEVDDDGGYVTKMYKGKTQLFGMFNSTTMTFAAKVKTLREDEDILRKWTNGTHPNDFQMFLELREKGNALLCPLNTFSTHGETMWLAPLYKVTQENLVEEWKNHLFQ